MKRIFIVILLLTLFASHISAKEIWENVGNGIYIDVQSVKNNKDGTATAIFKTFAVNERDLYNINGIKVYYTIDKWKAYCRESKVLDIKYSKLYDKNSTLLEVINDNGKGICADYNAYIDGETYYNAICNHKHK